MRHQAHSESFWKLTLVSLAAPLIWAGHLGLVYGVQHVFCEIAAGGGWFLPAFIGVATATCLAALAALGLAPRRAYKLAGAKAEEATMSFLVATTRSLSLLSFLGVLWAGASVLFIAGCAALR